MELNMSRSLSVLLFAAAFLLTPAGSAVATDPEPAAGQELTALERQLNSQYGPEFLPRLKALGVAPKDYLYASRLTLVGIQKVQENDFQDARFLLEKAYSIVPSPNLLYWIGMTHLGLEDTVRARAFFLRFLSESATWKLTAIKPDLLAATRTEIARLEKVLPRLKLSVSHAEAKVYLDGEFVGQTPMADPIYLTQGPHQLIVIKAGFARHAARINLTGAGRTTLLTVTLYTEIEHIRRTKVFRETEASRVEAQRRYLETRRRMAIDAQRRRATYAKWANITLISGAVLATASLTFGILMMHYDDNVEGAPPDTPWTQISADQEKADFFRTTTIAALGATLLSLGVSTWFTQLAIPPRSALRNVSVMPLASPSTVGFTVSFGF
ncbi:MAG: hypothetical protein CVU65_17035 [Deltaproteobacteria bacterium HGW-Deltaproteobacteria-22]|nr:MAG: hypothetical protein CVU65_17035 [Deltaproteobacteria bacterium HGW-Deltaproteobacteria-22]